MHTVWLGCYTLLCLPMVGFSSAAQAATPEHIFARAAPSVVVMKVLDIQGKVAAQGSGKGLSAVFTHTRSV